MPRSLQYALFAALAVRVGVLAAWPHEPCVRDACTWLELGRHVARGDGVVPTHGWLWAPGYAWLLGGAQRALGTPWAVLGVQIGAALATVALLHHLATALGGPRAGAVAAWIHALNPTAVYFAVSLWTETIYALLLLAAVAGVASARAAADARGAGVRGAAAGAVLGVAMLLRGVAAWLLPVLALLLARRPRAAATMVLVAALIVAPYTVHASARFGGLVIADRTLGQMMWLGNNTFAPVAFDWGDDALLTDGYARATAGGRPHCDGEDDPVAWDRCEVRNGLAWIAAHPGEFVARIPLRLSQLFQPHSFLSRHLRMGGWSGLPQAVDEGLVVVIVAWGALVAAGGTFALVALGGGPLAGATAAALAYHVGAVAALAGLSRYRVPLEPLWTVWVAVLLARPARVRDAPRGRRALAVLLAAVVLAEMAWTLPSGWPVWRTWG